MTGSPLFSRGNLLELNKSCYCFPIDRDKIDAHIIGSSPTHDMKNLLAARDNYFASTAVFISPSDISDIQTQIDAIESAVNIPEFQNRVFARGYNAAFDIQTKTRGVFMGYDFHMTADGPRLIEINSNAGGAFIVNALEQAIGQDHGDAEHKIDQMFAREWALAGRIGRPKTIAIIDENPPEQYHYPDMCLAADMLRRHGFDVIITDPKALRFEHGELWAGDAPIDFIYNRLTDFKITGAYSASLSQALAADAVVISPNPRHHALYADKRNLALLSDESLVQKWPLSNSANEALSLIPKTILVDASNAEQLWAERKQYFFKPYGGFGSKGVYKGAKVTKKVWAHIIQGGYIAQKFIPPPVRAVTHNEDKTELKFDLRAYTYDGEILLLAARVYQGQTTNLRTSGGGLAPVVTLESAGVMCEKP